jgi:hypothetical protein
MHERFEKFSQIAIMKSQPILSKSLFWIFTFTQRIASFLCVGCYVAAVLFLGFAFVCAAPNCDILAFGSAAAMALYCKKNIMLECFI